MWHQHILGALASVTLGHVAFAAASIVVAQVVFWLVRWQLVKRRVSQIPGLNNGLLGPMPAMMKNMDRLYDWDNDHFEKYGSTFKMTEPFWRTDAGIWTKDPANIEHFLKTNFRNYVKPDMLRLRMRDLIGDGIFRINHGYKGEYPLWHAQRKTMSKIFFKKNFENFLQRVFVRHSVVLCDVLREHAEAGTVVDAQKLMFAFTLDSIAEIGFGTHFNALRKPMNIGQKFDQAQETVFLRVLRPFFYVPVLGKLLYAKERENARIIRDLDEFSMRTIHQRRAAINKATQGGKQTPSDLGACVGDDCLSLFMTADPKKTMKFTDKQLRDIVMSVMIAGRDTTACTLSFAIAEAMLNPEVTAKLRAEIQDKLRHTTLCGGDAVVSVDDVTKTNMPYLHGFVYEVGRRTGVKSPLLEVQDTRTSHTDATEPPHKRNDTTPSHAPRSEEHTSELQSHV